MLTLNLHPFLNLANETFYKRILNKMIFFSKISHLIINSSDLSNLSCCWCVFLPENYQQRRWATNVGFEPTTLRLRVSCSTDWASRARYAFTYKLNLKVREQTKIKIIIHVVKTYCWLLIFAPVLLLPMGNFTSVY